MLPRGREKKKEKEKEREERSERIKRSRWITYKIPNGKIYCEN